MKKTLLLFAVLCTFMVLQAQDVIVKTDGTSVKAKVLMVSDDAISYRKWSNLKGPVYKIKIANVKSIKYKNGSVDKFKPKAKSSSTSVETASEEAEETNEVPATGFYKTRASKDNAKQMAIYNDIDVTPAQQPDSIDPSHTGAYILVYKLTKNSVLDNGDLCVNFKHTPLAYSEWIDFPRKKGHYFGMFLTEVLVRNKSNATIFIDLTQSTIQQGGNTTTLFGTDNSLGVANMRFIAISPGQETTLPYTGYYQALGIGTMPVNIGRGTVNEMKNYDENSTPDKLIFTLLYSKEAAFKNYTSISFTPYISRSICVKSIPTRLSNIDRIDKQINGADSNTPLVTTYELR